MALKTNGTLWATGDNYAGQLGINSTATSSSVFVQVGTATDWSQIACGDYFTIGLKTNGTLWSWGQNNTYQLGDGTCCFDRLSPAQVGSATDWAFIAVTKGATGLAIKTNGTLWGWGLNNTGLVGQSDVQSRQFPI